MNQSKLQRPKTAWKFTEPQFLDDLFGRGTIRLAAAEEIRLIEETAAGRGDAHELAHMAEHPNAFVIGDGSHPDDAEQIKVLRRLDWIGDHDACNNIGFVFKGPPVRRVFSHGLMFCVSEFLTGDMVRRMEAEFGYTACYRIKNLRAFADVIMSNHLPTFKGMLGRVEYGKRRVRVADDDWLEVHPLLKEPKYAWQRENRLVIEDPERRVEGFLLSDMALPALCDPVSAMQLDRLRRS